MAHLRLSERQDADILADARRRLLAEPLLGSCFISPNGEGAIPRAAQLFPEGCAGAIVVHVDHGVVTLEGEVPGPTERRLAEKAVGQIPGCHRVVNALAAPAAPGGN